MKKWYIVNVYSGFEDRVSALILEEAEKKGLSDFFGQILIPKEKILEIKKGEKKESEKKFFPGYILVEMDLSDTTWHLVRSIPKVSNFLGAKNNPAPVERTEIDKIMKQINAGETPRNSIIFEIGDMVKVLDGPFATFNGIVENVNEEHEKLNVSVSIFGRPTKLELGFAQVEKIR